MTPQPAVLLGIATRNRVHDLSNAILSGQAQGCRSLRIAVLDDASIDETPSLRGRFPDVAWQRFDCQRGVAAARNALMLSAPEDYYVSLDDDAWFADGDEIALAVDYLQRNGDVAVVAFDILSPDRRERMPRQAAQPASMFNGCGHVLRLSAIKSVGGYAEFPGLYGGEEKDMALRLIEAGFGIVKMPGVHVWHEKSPQARDLAAQHRSGVCNDLITIWKRAPLALLPAFLLWKFARHLLFAARRGLMRPCLDGFRDFARLVATGQWRREPLRLSTFSRYSALMASQADAP